MQTPDGDSLKITFSPLVFDLQGRGVRASDRFIRFDIDGDGRVDAIHDIASGAGVLVFDADHDGNSGANGRGLFGTGTDLDGDGKPDGFAALGAFVAKAIREGVLSRRVIRTRRLDSRDLAELEKAYGLKMKVGSLRGKAVSLREAGVDSIDLSVRPVKWARDFDGQGDDVLRQEAAVFTRLDGSKGSYEDVFFATQRGVFRPMPPNVAGPSPEMHRSPAADHPMIRSPGPRII